MAASRCSVAVASLGLYASQQPSYGCVTQVGIGAFVMNERREVLMVQERTGPLRGKGMWKLPTGLVNVGEDIR